MCCAASRPTRPLLILRCRRKGTWLRHSLRLELKISHSDRYSRSWQSLQTIFRPLKTTLHLEVLHQLHQLQQLSQPLRHPRNQQLSNPPQLLNQLHLVHPVQECLPVHLPNPWRASTASTWPRSLALVPTAASSKPTSKKLCLDPPLPSALSRPSRLHRWPALLHLARLWTCRIPKLGK